MKYVGKSLFFIASALTTASVLSASAQTAATQPTNHWTTAATVGLTITRGNADTTLFSFSVATERKMTNDDLKLGADIIYGVSKIQGQGSAQETADSDHGSVQDNHSFTDRFYGYLRVEALHDGIADVQYRLTIGPGAGYYLIKNKKLDLSVEGGIGYLNEKLDDEYQRYATLRAAQGLHYQISEHAKAWETIEVLPQANELNNYIVNFEVGAEAALNKKNKLALRTVLDDTYNNVPAAGRLKNDLKLIAGITYKF
jgi:putative salt-induced outer membrane protein YdiY